MRSIEDLPNVPLVVDLAKTAEQRAILRLIFARQALGRPFLGPPGIPADRAAALQAAFVAVMKDKALLAEAEKAKLEITPLGGDAVKKIIEESAKTDPAILKRAAAMLKVERPSRRKTIARTPIYDASKVGTAMRCPQAFDLPWCAAGPDLP